MNNKAHRIEIREIYQYVGDEVVITWPKEKGLKNNNLFGPSFFFELKARSKKKRLKYLKK